MVFRQDPYAVQQCLVEALAEAIGLRAFHLGPGVVDILDREVELILVTIVGAAILGTTVGQDPSDVDLVLVEERDHPIIEGVGRCQWYPTGVELGPLAAPWPADGGIRAPPPRWISWQLSATLLAAGLGMAVKNATLLLDDFCAAGIAIEVTHRSKRRLFGLTGLAPLRDAVRRPYRPEPRRGRGRPPLVVEHAIALPPVPPLARQPFDNSDLAHWRPRWTRPSVRRGGR